METGKTNGVVGQPVQPSADSVGASVEYAVAPRGSDSPAGHDVAFPNFEGRVKEVALERRGMRGAEEKRRWPERKPAGLDRPDRAQAERHLRGTEDPIPDYVMRDFGSEEEAKEGRDYGIRT